MSNNTSLPQTGFIRLKFILAPVGPIPVGKSTWWAGVKSGRFPKPYKLGPRTTAWRIEDIRILLDALGNPPPSTSYTEEGAR
jgi:prophage regulatory protein